MRAPRGRRWSVLALVAASAYPAAAGADRGPVAGAAPVVGPVLAGTSVVYAEAGASDLALWQATPGGAERRISVLLSRTDDDDDFTPAAIDGLTDLAASPLRVATGTSRTVTRVQVEGEQIASAPLGSMPETMVSTGTGAFGGPWTCGELSSGTVGVDADAVGYAIAVGRCPNPGSAGPYAVRVRDFADPGDPPEGRTIATDEGAAGPVRLAGRFVAWRRSAPTPASGSPAGRRLGVVVFDRTAGAVVSSLAGAGESYDVQDDGTLASVGADGTVTTLAVGGAPRVVLLGGAQRVRIAAGRVVIKRRRAGRDELVVVGASGAVTVLARSSADRLPFDFDGARVAWAQESCRGVSTLLVEDDPAAPDPTSVTDCPFAIGAVPARLTRGALELRLTCPKGCRGSVALAVGGGSVRRAYDATGRLTLRLALRARDRRALRRSGSIVGRLRAQRELVGGRVSTPLDRRVRIRG